MAKKYPTFYRLGKERARTAAEQVVLGWHHPRENGSVGRNNAEEPIYFSSVPPPSLFRFVCAARNLSDAKHGILFYVAQWEEATWMEETPRSMNVLRLVMSSSTDRKAIKCICIKDICASSYPSLGRPGHSLGKKKSMYSMDFPHHQIWTFL